MKSKRAVKREIATKDPPFTASNFDRFWPKSVAELHRVFSHARVDDKLVLERTGTHAISAGKKRFRAFKIMMKPLV